MNVRSGPACRLLQVVRPHVGLYDLELFQRVFSCVHSVVCFSDLFLWQIPRLCGTVVLTCCEPYSGST